jgi:hypothetical protein
MRQDLPLLKKSDIIIELYLSEHANEKSMGFQAELKIAYHRYAPVLRFKPKQILTGTYHAEVKRRLAGETQTY